MLNMKLSIISLSGIQFDSDVVSLNVKTTSGEITVLDNHRPLITELKKSKAVVIKKGGEKLNFDIKSGFLEISDNNCATILAS